MTVGPETFTGIFAAYVSLGNIFLFALAIFTLFSIVLLYHWFHYAFSSTLTWLFMIIYFGVSAVLLSVMLGAVIFS